MSQLSVAVTFGAVGTSEHSSCTLAGTPAKTGAELSVTVIVCIDSLVFPHASVSYTHLTLPTKA